MRLLEVATDPPIGWHISNKISGGNYFSKDKEKYNNFIGENWSWLKNNENSFIHQWFRKWAFKLKSQLSQLDNSIINCGGFF